VQGAGTGRCDSVNGVERACMWIYLGVDGAEERGVSAGESFTAAESLPEERRGRDVREHQRRTVTEIVHHGEGKPGRILELMSAHWTPICWRIEAQVIFDL
jgi:rubredoxin